MFVEMNSALALNVLSWDRLRGGIDHQIQSEIEPCIM